MIRYIVLIAACLFAIEVIASPPPPSDNTPELTPSEAAAIPTPVANAHLDPLPAPKPTFSVTKKPAGWTCTSAGCFPPGYVAKPVAKSVAASCSCGCQQGGACTCSRPVAAVAQRAAQPVRRVFQFRPLRRLFGR